MQEGVMATPDYWAEAPLDRQRVPLFARTLDATIADDDCVRLFDDVLSAVDWSAWEAEYGARERGQPPIHPRHLAAAILYGLYRGIRSSRKLEEACYYRFDFIWLLEGRRPDHSTLAKFRTRFRQPLKDLFRQLGHIALTLGLVRLGEVAFDGTRVKANNSRFQTRTAKTLEAKLQALDALFEHLLAESETLDTEQVGTGSPARLPEELAALERRRQKLRQALDQVRAADATRRQQGVSPEKNPAQLPTTDPDSRVMPNKEGGYAPNYTPVATTDGHRGFIVDCEVTAEVHEGPQALASVDRIEETFGQKPEKFLTDAGNNSGQIQAAMEARGVEFYAPVESSQPQPGNPACRDDPTHAVPPELWSQLPRNDRRQLDKSCFVYDAVHDQYYCPQGHSLRFDKTTHELRGSERVTRRIYRCLDCAGCPLAAACLSRNTQHGRAVTRDEYEDVRERTAARMATAAARELYHQRPRIAETTFGLLKRVMGLRQFLLRGLEKVRTEWRWACTAFNLGKLVRALALLRAQLTQAAAAE
jgi:transposase